MTEIYCSNEETESAAGNASTSLPLSEGVTQADTPNDHKVGVRFAELRAMELAYGALAPLDKDGQNRAVRWLTEALEVEMPHPDMIEIGAAPTAKEGSTDQLYAREKQLSPRDFISQKKPQSAVERVACLAYYLTHYRETRTFKTSDIVALNTEAAVPKFGNPSRDVDNADRSNGYIVSAGNGAKQLTVRGELVVEALPDREAVKVALENHTHKQRRSSSPSKKSTARTGDEQ